MDLQEYLEAIRTCPDVFVSYEDDEGTVLREHMLSADYGIHDNMHIDLSGDPHDLVDALVNSEDYLIAFQSEDADNWILHFLSGSIELHILDRPGYYNPLNDGIKKINLRIQDKCSYGICFHPGIYTPIPDVVYEGDGDIKEFISPIMQIAEYALQNKLVIAFPDAIGQAHVGDASRMVIHPKNLLE